MKAARANQKSVSELTPQELLANEFVKKLVKSAEYLGKALVMGQRQDVIAANKRLAECLKPFENGSEG